jgi:fibronectin type 3 domain-containing protein
VAVAVRLVSPRGRASDWSNVVNINVEPPLDKPTALHVEAVPDGVRISWTAPGANTFRVFRKAPLEKEATLLALAEKPEYIDTNTEYGKLYEYSVQATHEQNTSDVAGPESVTPIDKFPPRTPVGLTASTGVGAIELAWERNTEPDFKQYRVYRSEEGGPFAKIAEGLDSPNYSDRSIAAGKHYRYQITAEDLSGNESKPSEPVEALLP